MSDIKTRIRTIVLNEDISEEQVDIIVKSIQERKYMLVK